MKEIIKKPLVQYILMIILGVAIGTGIWLVYTALNKEETIPNIMEEPTAEQLEELEETETVIPEGAPDIINFYIAESGSNNRELLEDTYTVAWTRGTDIATFNPLYLEQERIEGTSVRDIWEQILPDYPNSEGYKIGYELTFSTTDGEENTYSILSPKDTEEFFDYIEIYLYDGYHIEPGARYSHILESEVNDETILTSIKVTPGANINDVSSIKLKTFVYSSDDDFDAETGLYSGTISDEVEIIKSN